MNYFSLSMPTCMTYCFWSTRSVDVFTYKNKIWISSEFFLEWIKFTAFYVLLVKLEWRSKILFDTMNLKHVALLNLLHYIGGILQYNSTSANYVRFWVIKCTGYDRPVFIDSSHNVCDRH